MAIPIRNTTGWVIGAQMINATSGQAFIGNVTVYVTGDGGTQQLGQFNSGICVAEGNGYYSYTPLQVETNYTLVAFTFIGSGAVPATIQVPTETAASAATSAGTSTTLSFTVRSVATDALIELGVLEPGETMTAAQGSRALRRTQMMIDSWAADRLTLSLQLMTTFTWPNNQVSVQVGPGQTVNIDRPVWIDDMAYIVPSTSGSNAVEVGMAQLDYQQYAAITIKNLQSTLPTQYFYQTNVNDANGTLYVWPVPPSLQVVLYTPQAVGVPATLDSILRGPQGYQDAFLYDLAWRLVNAFGVAMPVTLPQMRREALAVMKRPNVQPGILGVDPALAGSGGAGYNILSDSNTSWRR